MDADEGGDSDSESSRVDRRYKTMTSPISPIVTGVISTDAGEIEMAESSLVNQRLRTVSSPTSPIVTGSISKASPGCYGADGGASAAVNVRGRNRRTDVEDVDDDGGKHTDDNVDNDDNDEEDDDNDSISRGQSRIHRKTTHQNLHSDSRRMDSTVVRRTDGPASALGGCTVDNEHAKRDATGNADAEDLTGSSGSLPLSGSLTSSRADTRRRSIPLSESVSSGANTWQPESSSSSSESPTQVLSLGVVSAGQRVPSEGAHQAIGRSEQSAEIETTRTEQDSGFSLKPAGAQAVFKMFKRFFDSTPVHVA